MIDRDIIEELISLDAVRVQKIWGLFNTILVMELYSRTYKRLFFIFDQNPSTRTFHVQKDRPQGVKTKSPLVLSLNKYAVDQTLRFFKLDDEGSAIKAIFANDGIEFSLMFEFFPTTVVGLFRGSELIAAGKADPTLAFRKGFLSTKQVDIGLEHNFNHADIYGKKLLHFHQKVIFDGRVASMKRDIAKKHSLLKNVEGDLAKCQHFIDLAKDAELLRSNLHLFKRGMTEVQVIDYTIDPPAAKKISLDPLLHPHEFLEKTFKKIKKAKRGFAIISARLNSIKGDIEQLNERLVNISKAGASTISLGDINEAVKTKIASKKGHPERLPFRVYLSSDQIKILVGKSAKDSDYLTLHLAKGNEWWFHARDVAGTHVVVKNNLDALPKKTLIEAALLAAHFSKDKSNPRSVVQYTRVKNVRKPKGLVPGKVLITQEKTLEIVMDQKVLKALLDREQKISV